MSWYYWCLIIVALVFLIVKLGRIVPNGRAIHLRKLKQGTRYKVGAVTYFALENRFSAIVRQNDNLADPLHIFFDPSWNGDIKVGDIFMVCISPYSDLPYLRVLNENPMSPQSQ